MSQFTKSKAFKPTTPCIETATPSKMSQTLTSKFFDRTQAKLATPVESPLRVKRGLNSPAVPGGFQINSPANDHAMIGDLRDNSRVTGFGPGMASALIGNNNRLKGGKFILQSNSPRTDLGSIGWGSMNPKLD